MSDRERLAAAVERLDHLMAEAFSADHPAMHDYALLRIEYKRLSALPVAERAQPQGEAVAWRVRDFAGDWILCHTEREARRNGEDAGCYMEPLHRAPPAAQPSDPWAIVEEMLPPHASAAQPAVPEGELLPGLREALLFKPNTPQLENAMTYAWTRALEARIRSIAAAPGGEGE